MARLHFSASRWSGWLLSHVVLSLATSSAYPPPLPGFQPPLAPRTRTGYLPSRRRLTRAFRRSAFGAQATAYRGTRPVFLVRQLRSRTAKQAGASYDLHGGKVVRQPGTGRGGHSAPLPGPCGPDSMSYHRFWMPPVLLEAVPQPCLGRWGRAYPPNVLGLHVFPGYHTVKDGSGDALVCSIPGLGDRSPEPHEAWP